DLRVVGNKGKAGLALWLAGAVSSSKMKIHRQAITLFADAWPLLQEAGRVKEAIWARLGLGLSYQELGKLQEAVMAFDQAIKDAESSGPNKMAVFGYHGLGRVHESLGDFEKALENYEAALQSHRTNEDKPDPSLEGELLYLKGQLHRLLSQYEDGIGHFFQAAVKYREARAPIEEAASLTQLAEIFFWIADYKEAAKYYKQSLEVYKETGDVSKQVETLAALAQSSWLSGVSPIEEINGYLEEGQKLLKSIEAQLGVEPFTPLMAAQEKTQRKFLGEATQRVLEWKKKIPSLPSMDAYAAAYVEFMIGESKNTFQDWRQKVPSLGYEYLMALGSLRQKSGMMFLFSGNPKLAIELLIAANAYHGSLPFSRDLGVEWAKEWFYLGEAFRREGNFDAALMFFRRAKMMATLLRTPEIHWLYAGLAHTYADMGNSVIAVGHYKMAFELLESVRGQQGTEEFKIGVFEGALYLYRRFVTLLLEMYRDTGEERYLHDAFQYNENMRARAFLDMLGRSSVTRLAGKPGSLAQKEEQIHHQIARIYRQLRTPNLDKAEETRLLDQLESLRKRWRALEQQAAHQNQRYAQIVSPRPVTVEEVQSILDPNSVLLEYSAHAKGLTLWVITKDQVQTYSLPGSKGLPVLEQYLKTLREPLMGWNEVSRHLAIGRKLYWALVEPAEQQIRGKTHLIIAPDGPLYYLPFEALIMPVKKEDGDVAETLANARYLVKEFRITYVPSASVLVTQRKGRNSQ
ncbi:MAG: tetratricopeptide repeat protein, partial [Candidatus Binatia bacterium]